MTKPPDRVREGRSSQTALRVVPQRLAEPQLTRAAAFLALRDAAQSFVARQTDTTFEQLAATVAVARLLKLF